MAETPLREHEYIEPRFLQPRKGGWGPSTGGGGTPEPTVSRHTISRRSIAVRSRGSVIQHPFRLGRRAPGSLWSGHAGPRSGSGAGAPWCGREATAAQDGRWPPSRATLRSNHRGLHAPVVQWPGWGAEHARHDPWAACAPSGGARRRRRPSDHVHRGLRPIGRFRSAPFASRLGSCDDRPEKTGPINLSPAEMTASPRRRR